MLGPSHVDRPNARGGRCLAHGEPPNWSMLICSGGRLLSSRHITGGHPLSDGDCTGDDRLASVITCTLATTGHAVTGGQSDIVDPVACLYPALVEATTLGGATVVATTDVVNNTPSHQTDSAGRCLKRRINQVTTARQSPLLELLGDDSTPGRHPPPVLPRGADG